MIKGINRQVIEILDTGNPYFERALLVVQPGMDDADNDTLHSAAREMLKTADSCSHLRRGRRRQILARTALSLTSAACGGGIALLLRWWLM